jgi:uncharacterized membrane protein YgaE (UPF0421/DUF939 family)
VARLRERGPAVLTRLLRLTGAALLSYLVAGRVVDDPRPVTAALTALLVVQVTLVGTFTDTLRRVVSVFAGVVLAIGVSLFVGFTWWSLGAVIAASILLGQALRLGPHLLEVPISAMLILAVGGQEALAWDRIIETLIGAGAGLLLNLAFPPAVQTRTAGAAVEQRTAWGSCSIAPPSRWPPGRPPATRCVTGSTTREPSPTTSSAWTPS